MCLDEMYEVWMHDRDPEIVYQLCIQVDTVLAFVYIMILPSGRNASPVTIRDNMYIHRGIHFAERKKNPAIGNMC
jgi:hypothetical protein